MADNTCNPESTVSISEKAREVTRPTDSRQVFYTDQHEATLVKIYILVLFVSIVQGQQSRCGFCKAWMHPDFFFNVRPENRK